MKEINADKLVNHVQGLWANGINRDDIVLENIRSEFGLSENDAERALEFVKTGRYSERQTAPKKPWWKFW